MKVVAKFALAFLLVSAVCLGLYGYLTARGEVRALERGATSDLRALGEGVREGMIVAWAHGGDAAAAGIVDAVNARRSDVALRWTPAAPPGDATTATIAVAGDERVVRVTVPVAFASGTGGTLELSRGVPSEARVLRDALASELAVAGGLVLGAAVLVAVLGVALIGRPLERVVAQARRVGAGDLSVRLDERRSDEIGALKRELNTMCDRIAEARARAEEESTARVETLEQLRHLDRLRTVGMLASSLAHELGTPLNVLLMRGQSLAEGDVAGDAAKDAGKVVVAQVEKMSRIVRQLMDFSRREGRAGEKARLSEVARASTVLLESLAHKHRVDVRVEVVDDVPVVGSADQLEQAVTNLVVNAIQAMPSGGTLDLVVRSDARATPPGSSREIAVGVLEVRDRGVGIAPEDLERIFEPFYTTKPAGKGTGLGLSVASGIAAERGGWISAKSALGEGSTFSLHVPRAAS